jgi:hypothetical protein
VFTARGADPTVNTTRSKVFGDVDSGDVRPFATENGRNVIWPRKGATAGAPGPIALSIQLWEADQGNAEEIAKQTEKVFDLGGEAPVIGEWIRRVPGIVRNQIADFIGDDLMGSKTLHFPANRLARQLPNVGSRITQKYRFGGNSGDLPFEVAGGPDYDLIVEVARVA